MNKKIFKNLFTLIFLSIINISFAQNGEALKKLDVYIQSAIDSLQQPGLSVGIIKNNKVIFAKGYGVKSVKTKESVNTQTLFGIASLSKAFTATSIGLLVDEGKLDWDDKVIDHLTWFQLNDPYVTRELKIKDLLCHRVGLATFDGDLLWYGTNYSREEIVKRIRELPLKNSFRDKYGYQNIMFIVAGEVIKAVSGKTWEEFVKERIFKPLDMKYSTITNSEFDKNTNVALPHIERKVENFISYDNAGPAASINSCVEDMLKWANFWIKEGKVDTTQLLSQRSYNTITQAYMGIPVRNKKEIGGKHFSATALGWFLNDYAGRKVMAHGGGLPGYLSRFALVPEDSLGLVVLQNDMTPAYSIVEDRILDVMLTEKDVDYIGIALDRTKRYNEYKQKIADRMNESRVKDTEPSLKLEDYAGTYSDKMYGDAEIKLSDDELQITLLPTKELFTSKMEHWHFDTFRIKFNDNFLPHGFITFNKNSKAEITDFIIDLPNPDFHFYNLKFVKKN